MAEAPQWIGSPAAEVPLRQSRGQREPRSKLGGKHRLAVSGQLERRQDSAEAANLGVPFQGESQHALPNCASGHAQHCGAACVRRQQHTRQNDVPGSQELHRNVGTTCLQQLQECPVEWLFSNRPHPARTLGAFRSRAKVGPGRSEATPRVSGEMVSPFYLPIEGLLACLLRV